MISIYITDRHMEAKNCGTMMPAFNVDTHYNSIETRKQIPTDNKPYWLVVNSRHLYDNYVFE